MNDEAVDRSVIGVLSQVRLWPRFVEGLAGELDGVVIGRDELDAAAQPDALGALPGCRQDLKRNSTL